MEDFDALLDAFLVKVKDNPAFVALHASPSDIYAYHHAYPVDVNLFDAIRQIKPGQTMFAWTGTSITNRSRGIEHQLSAYLRPKIPVGQVFKVLRDGIVTTGGEPMKRTRSVFGCDPPDFRGCFSRSVFITDQSSIDYHEITIAFTERGADN